MTSQNDYGSIWISQKEFENSTKNKNPTWKSLSYLVSELSRHRQSAPQTLLSAPCLQTRYRHRQANIRSPCFESSDFDFKSHSNVYQPRLSVTLWCAAPITYRRHATDTDINFLVQSRHGTDTDSQTFKNHRHVCGHRQIADNLVCLTLVSVVYRRTFRCKILTKTTMVWSRFNGRK